MNSWPTRSASLIRSSTAPGSFAATVDGGRDGGAVAGLDVVGLVVRGADVLVRDGVGADGVGAVELVGLLGVGAGVRVPPEEHPPSTRTAVASAMRGDVTAFTSPL
jgi:hypothetical protein